MKDCKAYFDGFVGSVDAVGRLCDWMNSGRLPHAILLTAPDGCGKNQFALDIAAAYLADTAGLVLRDVHPDCLVVAGEGASGNIPVARIRDLGYALSLSSVMTDGRRVAILKNVRHLNRNSANALLKMLEEPPAGVIFLLTAVSAWDILPTLTSRCVEIPLSVPAMEDCAALVTERYPNYDAGRIQSLTALYGGKPGLVLKALSSPERLALCDAARRFCTAALQADKLAALSALDCGSREDLANLLSDALQILRMELTRDYMQAACIKTIHNAIKEALDELGRYANEKIVAAHLIGTLAA